MLALVGKSNFCQNNSDNLNNIKYEGVLQLVFTENLEKLDDYWKNAFQ